jgi:GTP-binding protein
VVLQFLDPRMHISRVDKQLVEYILEQLKPAIFVVNKWDLAGSLKTGTFADYVHQIFPMLDFVPTAFISARDGKNVGALLKLAKDLAGQAKARVGTGELNRVLKLALEAQAPPLRQNRRAKVYYATQVDVAPPTIVLFCNDPALLSNTYRRHLLKTFRDQLPFGDVPIKLVLRKREHGVEGEWPARAARPKKKRVKKPESELWDV